MIGKQKEKWMEVCELAVKEQDPEKLMALVTEIDRLFEEQTQQRQRQKKAHYLVTENRRKLRRDYPRGKLSKGIVRFALTLHCCRA